MIPLTSSQVSAFVADACAEIEKSHNDAWNDINTSPKLSRPQYEAQFVARLCAGASGIAAKWRPRIRKINPSLTLSFASVFTHQSPYVEWPPATHANRCELADLLIAIIDRTNPPGDGRAVLIQAKQSDTGTAHLTTPSEKDQFDLLSGRPVFDVDSTTPAPSGVDLSAMTPDDALQYGLNPPDATPATPSSWANHRWTMADTLASLSKTPPVKVTASPCLADWMVEQLQSNRGWKFDLPPTKHDWAYFTKAPYRDDWSALINYLLAVTFYKPLNQLAFSGSPPDRGMDEPLCFVNRTPKGKVMFALFNRDRRERLGLRRQLPPARLIRLGESRWRRVESIPWTALSGDGGAGGGAGREGNLRLPPDNGPISVIVFEIGKRPE